MRAICENWSFLQAKEWKLTLNLLRCAFCLHGGFHNNIDCQTSHSTYNLIFHSLRLLSALLLSKSQIYTRDLVIAYLYMSEVQGSGVYLHRAQQGVSPLKKEEVPPGIYSKLQTVFVLIAPE